MANGGKGGGSKGGGAGGGGGSKGGTGKGGGGKGKKGGGCSPGDIVNVGLSSTLFQRVKNAFNSATASASGTTMTVQLECTDAQNLVIQIASGMATNFAPQTPKGKKGGK
jgi:hypothetical protein